MSHEATVEFSRGMVVEVTHTHEVPPDPGETEWREVERTDTGVITAVPSRKFPAQRDPSGEVTAEAFDFDYELQTASGRGTTRSVDTEREVVYDLHYRAGGDADWATYTLVDVTVTGVDR